MIYPFACYECLGYTSIDARPLHPPKAPMCVGCKKPMTRVYGCYIDTSGCKDHDEVPVGSRVTENTAFGETKVQGDRKEAVYQRELARKRRLVRQAGPGKDFRMTHSIPTELFHGKIKQTGDKDYWKDPKNRNRHKSCEVSG